MSDLDLTVARCVIGQRSIARRVYDKVIADLIAEVERLEGMEEAFFKSAKTIEALTKERDGLKGIIDSYGLQDCPDCKKLESDVEFMRRQYTNTKETKDQYEGNWHDEERAHGQTKKQLAEGAKRIEELESKLAAVCYKHHLDTTGDK